MTYNCHLCDSALEPIVNLGMMPLANDLLDPNNPQEKYWFEGNWSWCPECEVLELVDVPPAEVVYTESYPYLSGTSKYMDWHFKRTACDLFGMYRPLNVLEIAVNDGGILQFFPREIHILGIDPMASAWPLLEQKCVPYIGDKFNSLTSQAIKEQHGEFDLVYCANTLRSLATLGDFFKGVDTVLSQGGIFVFEDPYLPDFLDRNEWDQLYSENIWGFTITAVNNIAKRYGFRLFDIDPLPANHGGTMRYHLARESLSVSGRGDPMEYAQLRGEHRLREKLDKWQTRIDANIEDFKRELEGARDKGQRVVGYAATAKSVTVLNYLDAYLEGPDVSELMPYVYDTTPNKIGKLLPGVNIPIRDASEFDADTAELAVLWAYNHANEIISRERDREWLLMFPMVHRRRR